MSTRQQMLFKLFLTVCVVGILCVLSEEVAMADAMVNAMVGDAYVHADKDGLSWKVGTKAVEMTYECRNGLFMLCGFTNKLAVKPCEYVSKTSVLPALGSPESIDKWVLGGAVASQETMGGRPVAQLVVELNQQTTKARFHVAAYPGTSVIRQWVELENIGSSPFAVPSNALSIGLTGDAAASFTHYWIVGGNSKADQGMMHSIPLLILTIRPCRPDRQWILYRGWHSCGIRHLLMAGLLRLSILAHGVCLWTMKHPGRQV